MCGTADHQAAGRIREQRQQLTLSAGIGSTPPDRSHPARSGIAGPPLLVAAAVTWNLVNLRAETLPVPYLDDSSVHEQMVRFATRQLGAGQLPLSSWFPFLGLGSPQFLHYQSLPATLTGLIGLVTGPDVAFRWSLYLLLSLWPLSVYLAARLFEADRWACAISAVMSPFLASVTGIGYEQHAYVWTGFGVWTQLWASLTLPLAWGLSWRAIRDGRGFFAAIALVSLTIALHFETGYLALMPLLLWPFLAGARVGTWLLRAAAIAAGSLLATAWVLVPLIEQRPWAATNEILRGTPLVNGYGAVKLLGWLVTGQLLDHGRLPVVTAFAVIGLVLACTRCRGDPALRALVVLLAGCLLLSFGRTTFGALVGVIPGSGDIFFRRFMMGVQLAALLLAGDGAAWAGRTGWRAVDRWAVRRGLGSPATGRRTALLGVTPAILATVGVLAPAWLQLGAYDRHNAAAIAAQRLADDTRGTQLDRLIAEIKQRGGGRTYAGMPSNWGASFTVGAVPVFKYLEAEDVDEVGYTLRTASLMTDPEYYFDQSDPGDYRLFGIHYLILPSGDLPPVPARPLARSGAYRLWLTGSAGYVQVGRIVGRISENRTNVGVRSIPLLDSDLAQKRAYVAVAFGVPGADTRRLPVPRRGWNIGSVVTQTDALAEGMVAATVKLKRAGVVVLSVSFDPGWSVTVDGRRRSTLVVAPALVAVRVGAGTHRIVFRFRGPVGYSELFALGALALLAAAVCDIVRRRVPRIESAG